MGKEQFSRLKPAKNRFDWVRLLWPGNIQDRKKRRRYWVAWLCSISLILLFFVFLYFSYGLPDVGRLNAVTPYQTTHIFDRNGELIGELFETRRSVIPLEKVPRVMVLSVLAAEDADFYTHEGMDIPGIARVLLKGLMEGEVTQGASTITQQLVKNALLSPERTLRRKIRELILARRVEKAFSKDEILHLYLNLINFGHARHGVQEAARFYFGKDAAQLNLAEASLLAGIPKAPARLSPLTNPENAEERRQFTLDQLASKRAEKWPELTEEEIDRAREERPHIVPWVNKSRLVPEIVPMVRGVLEEKFGEENARRGGYQVHTTVDLELQRNVREQLREGLARYDKQHRLRVPLRSDKRSGEKALELSKSVKIPQGKSRLKWGHSYTATVLGIDPDRGVLKVAVKGELAHMRERSFARYNPDDLPLAELAEPGARLEVVLARKLKMKPSHVVPELGPQGAVCVIDVKNRHVLALVGGYSARAGFNRATQALRQPGSTFKPLVYALALKTRKFTPASIMVERRGEGDSTVLSGEEELTEKEPVNLRKALAKSVNKVAMSLIHTLGPEEVADFARQMGVSSELEVHPGLALGSSEVRVDEMTNVYATFASGGHFAPMRFIQKIMGPDGRPIPLNAPKGGEPLTQDEAYLTTNLMESVITEGTGRRALILQRPLAGKTGTSNDSRDAWFLGYTPEVVVGVWVGYDDFRPLGEEESGRESALPIWIEVMRAATDSHPVVHFKKPPGVVRAEIDPENGLRAYEGMEGAVSELFLKGTVPRDYTPYKNQTDAGVASVPDEAVGEDSPPPETGDEATSSSSGLNGVLRPAADAPHENTADRTVSPTLESTADNPSLTGSMTAPAPAREPGTPH